MQLSDSECRRPSALRGQVGSDKYALLKSQDSPCAVYYRLVAEYLNFAQLRVNLGRGEQGARASLSVVGKNHRVGALQAGVECREVELASRNVSQFAALGVSCEGIAGFA